jgi:C_GCAxxG_C_C family probable redox protein
MDSPDKAMAWHRLGYNCAQAVICALSGSLGIDERTVKLMASGFGGGMGREQLTCGAVAGAVMAVGCRWFDPDDVAASKERVYARTREVLRRFRQQHGSVSCRELLGIDIGTPEGQAQAREQDLYRQRCEPFIMDACRLVERMLAEDAGGKPQE